MAIQLYLRVSTEEQGYEQQRNTINKYMASHGISQGDIENECVEKISGRVKHTERKLCQLLKKCASGDKLLVSELSRLGRSMNDLNNIVTECCEREIDIIQCKDGMTVENRTIGGKALLFALSLAAEIEVENNHQRVQSGVDVAIAELKKYGKRIARSSGKVQTKWGAEKGADMTKQHEALALIRAEKAAEWYANSMAVQRARLKQAEGWRLTDIVADLCELYDAHANEPGPNPYGTPTGLRPIKGTVSLWLKRAREMY